MKSYLKIYENGNVCIENKPPKIVLEEEVLVRFYIKT